LEMNIWFGLILFGFRFYLKLGPGHRHVHSMGVRPPSQVLCTVAEKRGGFKKKNLIFFDQKLRFTYPTAFIKEVQATGEAFGTQKRTSSNVKHEISSLFLFLWVIFALLDPDSDPSPLT
jgi:hypothetical protein